ncbi:MAG TPA: cytochrome P460 family protein [Candidatus Acidoferrales bacterium]|nr:cytochrome P460 family protein [Candidatus Acidoferrales bacterium]
MRSIAFAVAGALIFTAAALRSARTGRAPARQAQLAKDDQLARPLDYRQWVYLSSGLGMEYSASSYGPQLFTNVFVAPAAYRQFLATGKWPDGTMFVLEEREGLNKGSINKAGHYQGDLEGLSASVKDASRFPGGWAYFKFANGASNATPMPRPACWECHNAHGAVDNTFVQFYPTLKPVARKFGAYDERKTAAP